MHTRRNVMRDVSRVGHQIRLEGDACVSRVCVCVSVCCLSLPVCVDFGLRSAGLPCCCCAPRCASACRDTYVLMLRRAGARCEL